MDKDYLLNIKYQNGKKSGYDCVVDEMKVL